MSDYAKQERDECPCASSYLHTANSDGSNPHDESRDLVEIALDAVLLVLAAGMFTFTIFALIGFWSQR